MKELEPTINLVSEPLLEENFNNSVEICIEKKEPKLEETQANFFASIAKLIAEQNQISALKSVSRSEKLPLSFAQERLWLLNQLLPDNPCYNQPLAFKLEGELNTSVLERSLQEIVHRHEVLRTAFQDVDGQVSPVINPNPEFHLSILDCTTVYPLNRQIQSYLIEEIQRPFDLCSGLLLRASLIQVNLEEHILVLVLHHIACDAWSEGILLKELSTLYNAFCSGESSPLPQLSIQYVDFAHWQRQWLQGEKLESQRQYWQQKLAGNLETLQLPTQSPRLSSPTYQGTRQSIRLSHNLTQDLKAFCQKQDVTLFVTLLSAFKTLLYHYTQQEDILLCSPFAGRNRSEIQNLIGYFNNVLPLRTNLSGNPTFSELLSRVKITCSESFQYQDIPLQTLAELPTLAGKPLSRALFTFLNLPDRVLKLSGITVTPLEVDNQAADFDLFLTVEEQEEQLIARFQYKTDLFNDKIILEMLENFQRILESFVTQPQQTLADLPQLGLTNSYQPVENLENSAGIKPESEKIFVAAQNALELQLTKIWEQVLGKHPIGITDNFFELGGHSLLAVRLVAEIEKSFNKKLPTAALFQAPTIEKLAQILRLDGWSGDDSSLVIIQASGTKPPLFILQVLGEGLSYCLPLARYLGPDQPVYGLSVGVMSEEAWKLVEDSKDQYIKDLRRVQPKGPYFIAGAFCGGRMAYKVAEELHAQGETVALVALLNTLVDHKAVKKLSFLQKLTAHLKNLLRLGPTYLIKKCQRQIKNLENHILSRYCQALQSLGLPLPQKLKDFAMQQELNEDREAKRNRMRNSFVGKKGRQNPNAKKKKQPFAFTSSLYEGQVTLFRPADEIAFYDPQFGWNSLAPGGLEVHDVPGDFYTMFEEPNVQVLAEKLKACLNARSQELGQ